MPRATTVEFPRPFEPVKRGTHWYLEADGQEVKLSNLPKLFWPKAGYTKGDLLGAYYNLAPALLPYLHDRPLTLRRLPDGAEGDEFYEKNAPAHTPDWMPRAFIEGHGARGHTDFLMAQDTASLLYVANLGCIEMHPMHARQFAFDRPDYAFFDLDPFPPIEFSTVRAVAKMVGVALRQLGLDGVVKISGATGIVVYVPLDGSHTYLEARAFVERVCRLINKANPAQTTMEWEIPKRSGKVFLDFGMVSEGRNIASVYSIRPTPTATVGVPVTWDELDTDVTPEDFTIANVWERLERVGDLFEPMKVAGTPEGYNLTSAMSDLGIDVEALQPSEADVGAPVGDLAKYQSMRKFDVTSEPAGEVKPGDGRSFMIHKHHASRLHYDLRLERGGVLVSYAVPRGLPEVPNERRLAVHVEDHPIDYATFEGSIPKGEYGAGEARIYDRGTYDTLEWEPNKVTIRLHGERVWGEYHIVQTDGKQWLIFRSARDAPMPEPHATPSIEPMLATGGGTPFDDPGWVFEPKWDGVRTLAHIRTGTVKLVSRRGRDVTELYPELAQLSEQLAARNGLVDGEVVAFGPDGTPSFERIQQRFTQKRPSDQLVRANPVTFLAFDLLWLDGESLMDRPLEERRALLERWLVPASSVQISPTMPGDRGVAFFEAAKAQKLEGVVAKRLGSVYRPGQRTKDWVKIKAVKHQDCVVIGWSEGRGGRAGAIGSLVCGVYRDGTLTYAGNVGTGFTERKLAELAELFAPYETDSAPVPAPDELEPGAVHWMRPELVCSVEYLEFTTQGRMRAATFRGMRTDIPPEECTVE